RAPVVLAIAGETSAGDAPGPPLAPSAARAVMTGAPIPPGADAVVQVEWTEAVSDREVRIMKPVAAGANIRRAGSDIAGNSVPLRKGHLVRAYEQGVMASLGIGFIAVRRKPLVYFIPTGNELTEPGKPLGPGKIRESNSPVVTGLLRREGCDVRSSPITPDDRGLLSAAIGGGSGCDMFVTTGGVSAGRHDIVPEILADAGVGIVFHKVNIKPGMPLLFGMRGDTPFFSLPGNPVSAAVTFLQFVRPAIRKMSGDPDPGRKEIVRARLAAGIVKKDGKRHFLRGRLENLNGEPTVRVAGVQESNVASALAAADCLIILPEDRRDFAESEYVETEML
ncbi:MAG TPA: gephyrin-like molybdotransferase Glp, partial [Bacteroidota bacterium]|nr:gephyrin-like molybdotransferase Glp [Bacteroidota bacterium]